MQCSRVTQGIPTGEILLLKSAKNSSLCNLASDQQPKAILNPRMQPARLHTDTVTAITAVVAEHTRLALPTRPHALAACLFHDGDDDSIFARSRPAIARACAERVLEHIAEHVPGHDVQAVDVDELVAALCVLE